MDSKCSNSWQSNYVTFRHRFLLRHLLSTPIQSNTIQYCSLIPHRLLCFSLALRKETAYFWFLFFLIKQSHRSVSGTQMTVFCISHATRVIDRYSIVLYLMYRKHNLEKNGLLCKKPAEVTLLFYTNNNEHFVGNFTFKASLLQRFHIMPITERNTSFQIEWLY